MPKPKKGSKKHSAIASDSDGDFVDPIKVAATEERTEVDDPVLSLPPAPSKQKKTKSKKKKLKNRDDDDDDDEVLDKLKQLALSGSDDEGVARPVAKRAKNLKNKPKPTAASAFSMLGIDSGGSEDGNSADSDEGPDSRNAPQDSAVSGERLNGSSDSAADKATLAADETADKDELSLRLSALPADSGDDESRPSPSTPSAGKKDKKKKKMKKQKGQAADEEDLDAILANLDKPAATTMVEKPSGKQKKKGGTATSPADSTTQDPGHDSQQQSKISDGMEVATDEKAEVKAPEAGEEAGEESAAAKKRRKKLKQKERKEEGEGADVKEGEGEEEKDEGGGEGESEEAGKKKRKKKKDKKAAEGDDAAAPADSAADKKKPKNKAIAAMKEALAKAKEEQERMEREEEEKIRKLEEAKRLRDEEKKMKEEQRRKQREKDKERKERKKAEGKPLTAAQKAERERALQLIESRGLKLPVPGEKKKPYYGKPRKNKQQPKAAAEEGKPDTTPTHDESAKPDTLPEKIDMPPAVEEEVVEATANDVKDEWDAESEEEVEEAVTPGGEKMAVQALGPVAADTEKGEESSNDEESDGEDSEGGEESPDSEEESSEESSSEEEEMTPRERALARIEKRQQVAESNISTDKLRAPVVCVLGHVDTGKTKILDKLRRTNVQDGEAGGITQQIGATNVPLDAIHKQTSFVKDFKLEDLKVPGLLIIDTPGHESFSNLRTRGSSLCDIAILVIDIMHGLEPQTLESIQLLRKGKTPFVVALNKIDRLYGWKPSPHQDVQTVVKKQTSNTKSEFDERAAIAVTQLAEQGLNAALYYDNPNPKEYISLVPTSAHSGDGMGNLIALLCQYSQTFLAKRVAITDNLQCTVMEVKALPGLGTTVDVILVNGRLRNGDVVVMPGTEGPIVTHIRELLMPEPMRELRVKSQFKHHKEVEAAQGVKIVGKDLDKVMAGLPMYVAKYQDEVEVYKEWITKALKNVLNAIKLSPTGVFVQASTLGSMEALLEYLRSVKVPYAGINIGPVHKKDVMKASVMVEHSEPQYATILAFDVKVERDANELADSLGVKIFTADIIYHLFDAFTKYQEELIEIGRRENNHLKIFPCKLRILPQFIFNSRDPIIMGVSVESGFLSNGTPICVPTKEFIALGVVTSIERENKPVDRASKGMEVCIKIENLPGQAPRLYGRHFDENDMLVSKISRESIDAVKKYWKNDMSKEDWKLIIELKKTFEIL